MNTKNYQNLLHKELSYQIQGAAIEVRKNFGSGLKESIYQNAFAEELKSRNLSFEKEKSIQIFSPKTGKLVGSYRPDFIVEGKILVELKAVEKIPKMFLDQLYSYLRNGEYELGYFINFTSPKLYIKRIIYTNDRKPFLRNTRKNTNIRRISTKLPCLLVFLFVLFGIYGTVRAAEFGFDQSKLEMKVGEIVSNKVLIDTEGEAINAISVKIQYPQEVLKIREWSDGNSIINFWIQKPQVNDGIISFEGIIPGGYSGKNGLLLTVFFEATRPKEAGDMIFFKEDARALLNDGFGTPARVETKSLDLVVISVPISGPSRFASKDAEPPETFRPEIAKSPEMFDGKWFLVFATQDKGLGIDRYEIKETRYRFFGSFSTPLEASRLGRLPIFRWIGLLTGSRWISAESPYALRDQKLKSYIFVKAVDKAGNVRIEKILPQNPLGWYENHENWIIIILGVFLFIIWYLWRKLNTK